ncbi:MAG: LuxR C-terminal-related transcriptional regulator [Steroidobacteraceae bacterium]
MVQIIVAALDAEVRAALQSRLEAGGLGATGEIDAPAALDRALAELTEPLLVTGVSWPETAQFLEHACSREVPIALLLADEALDVGHPAFRHGAAALLPWPIAGATLRHALEAIDYGLRVLPGSPPPGSASPGSASARPAAIHRVPPAALAPRSPLSARERALLELVAAGLGNKAIARKLGVSINTVKYHLASIFAKLDARTRAEAVSAAARRGELML